MILITDEIQNDERLNWTEKAIVSYYRYWTVKGSLHGCCKTDKCVIDELHLDRRTFYRMKKHIMELGLIETDGGKTVYKGGEKGVKMTPPECQNDTTEVSK